MEYVLIYITAKDAEEAERIGDTLVSEKLAACANVLACMKSFYEWKGKRVCDSEVPLFLKTKKSLVQDVIKRVKEMHSYDVPCVIALPILDGNPDYLKWLGENTK
ncbi:MAG: divalent-cation tolerance protein CutA [Candidatus Aenigmatarchaeota archaeon]